MNKQLKDSLVLVLIFALIGGFFWYSSKQSESYHTIALLSETAHGTGARIEGEFKVSVHDANLTSTQVEAWAKEMKGVLRAKVKEDGYWSAPGLVGKPYYVVNDVQTYLYRDVYFDTADQLCKEHNVSYRLRNRFKSLEQHNQHMVAAANSEYWPYRAEFQAKFDRKELEGGFSTVMESRFEFREESEPFSKTNPPPGPPWPLRQYIPYFQSGRFAGLVTYPAQDVMRFFNERTGTEKLLFEPVVVFITERTRQHMHIDTPWGYGPNPTQAYIISFDNVTAYAADDYLQALDAGSPISDLKPVGKLVELEIEFERNVSQNLDKKIKELQTAGDTQELARLQAVREAFVADQKLMMSTLADYLKAEHQLELTPQKRSKFGQAKEF